MVAKKGVQVGQRVAPGTPLLGLVPLEDVWVDANFKEGQLAADADRAAGAPARRPVRRRASSISGRIRGFSPGTGAAFALLPAQNASGNWIKIVQRVPVRIALDPAQVREHPLRVGLSMHVEVDVHDQSGPVLTAPRRRRSRRRSRRAPTDDPATEALIARTIAANSGRRPRGDERAGREDHDRPLIPLPAGTRGLTAFALALGTFMQVLDMTIANVSLPTIAGNLGVSTNQGTWVITSFAVVERHLGAADRLADAPLRRRAHVRRVGRAVHDRVVPVRHRLELRVADRVPGAAGRGLRTDDARVAGAADVDLSGVAARHGARDLVDDHADRARSWDRCSAATSPTTTPGRGSS